MELSNANVERGDLGQRLVKLFSALETGLYERGEPLRLAMLAAIAGESLFLLGPPGVAKSLLARRLQNAFTDARCFDYLMGRFSTPDEIFGPVSINRLKTDDLYVRRTEQYLPEADIVFLDEIWKASPPIQNALLTALNEKIFRNGKEEINLPLKLLVAASNETAPDESSQAFWDRFLVRLELQSLQDPDNFLRMLADQSDPYRDAVPAALKIDRPTWQFWRESVAFVELGADALALIAALRAQLAEMAGNGTGPIVSDRRWKKSVGLLRAAAFCNEKAQVSALDCLILAHCLWNRPEERQSVRDLVEAAVRRHAWTERRRDGLLRKRLAGLQADLQAASGYDESLAQNRPIEAEGEYYLLEKLPSNLTVGAGGNWEARIWKPDYETLPKTAPGLESDIFLYRDGVYQSSQAQPIWISGEWAIQLGKEAIPLRCRQETVTRRVHRPLGDAEWAAWDQGIAALLEDCRREAQAVQSLIAECRAQAAAHFFVDAAAGEIWVHGLLEYLAELANLQSSAQGCQDQHGSC